MFDEVPQFNTQVEAIKTAATANAAATTEWATLNTEVPQSIEAIQARVDSLKPAALPKDVTKEELETAKTELETMKATWAEATTAASAGNPVEATEKGRTVQAKANELKNTLGMNETLASATPATAGLVVRLVEDQGRVIRGPFFCPWYLALRRNQSPLPPFSTNVTFRITRYSVILPLATSTL